MQENLLLHDYRRSGHEVTVLTSTFTTIFDFYEGNYNKTQCESVKYDSVAKIMHLKYRWHFARNVRPHRSISNILDQGKPDLVYVYDIMLNILECTRYVKRNAQSRMILDCHADYSNPRRNWISLRLLHGLWRKRFLGRSRPSLSMIFPIASSGSRFLSEIYEVKESEMELLPAG